MPTLARSQDAYDRFSAAVELPLTILALLWLPILVVPLVAPLPADVASTFSVIDYLVWAVFVVEYLVKLYLAPSRRRFFTSHLVDLAVIALPALRPLRALRLLRLLNLVRAGAVLANALKRTRDILTHRGLHFVLLAVLGIILVCSAVELGFEQHAHDSTIHNFGDALWWATTTVTTVGYGDKYPASPAGRGVAVVLMLVGIGLIGVLTATVASYFVEEKADQEKTELNQRLDRIEAMLAQALATPGKPDATIAPDGKDPDPQRSAGGLWPYQRVLVLRPVIPGQQSLAAACAFCHGRGTDIRWWLSAQAGIRRAASPAVWETQIILISGQQRAALSTSGPSNMPVASLAITGCHVSGSC